MAEISPERWEAMLDQAERMFPDEKWPVPREQMRAFVDVKIKEILGEEETETEEEVMRDVQVPQDARELPLEDAGTDPSV